MSYDSVPDCCVDLAQFVSDVLCHKKVPTRPDTGSGTEINNRKTICYDEIVPDRSTVPVLSFMVVSDPVGHQSLSRLLGIAQYALAFAYVRNMMKITKE